jgi:hypothetical protein
VSSLGAKHADGPTNPPTNQQMDEVSYKGAMLAPKKKRKDEEN